MNPYECRALRLAEDHCDGWRYIFPEDITFTRQFESGALWYPPGKDTPCKIVIGCKETPGILWHESFHGACHECPLSGDADRAWIEGLCNAFAACNDGIDRPALILAPNVVNQAAAGHRWTRLYGIPEELLLRKVGRGRIASDAFRDFFRWACRASQKEPGALSKELRYNPATGLFSQDYEADDINHSPYPYCEENEP